LGGGNTKNEKTLKKAELFFSLTREQPPLTPPDPNRNKTRPSPSLVVPLPSRLQTEPTPFPWQKKPKLAAPFAWFFDPQTSLLHPHRSVILQLTEQEPPFPSSPKTRAASLAHSPQFPSNKKPHPLTLSQTDRPPLHTDLPLPSAGSLPNGRSPKQENRLSLNQRPNPSLWKPSRRPKFFLLPWPKQLPDQHPPVHRPASTSRPHGRQQQGQPPLPPTGSKTTDTPPAPTASSPIFNHPDGNKQRRRWTQKKKALTEGDDGRSKRKRENRSKIYCLCCWVALQVTGRCTAGTSGKRRRRRSRSTSVLVFAGDGTWIHAPPVAVVREVHAPPVFPQIPDGFPAVTVMFGGMYPVILELLRFCLVNFDFCSHC